MSRMSTVVMFPPLNAETVPSCQKMPHDRPARESEAGNVMVCLSVEPVKADRFMVLSSVPSEADVGGVPDLLQRPIESATGCGASVSILSIFSKVTSAEVPEINRADIRTGFVPSSYTNTESFFMRESVPPGPEINSFTEYKPDFVKVCTGLVSEEVSLSPKFQCQEVIVPVDASVKDTLSGATPLAGVRENEGNGLRCSTESLKIREVSAPPGFRAIL